MLVPTFLMKQPVINESKYYNFMCLNVYFNTVTQQNKKPLTVYWFPN